MSSTLSITRAGQSLIKLELQKVDIECVLSSSFSHEQVFIKTLSFHECIQDIDIRFSCNERRQLVAICIR